MKKISIYFLTLTLLLSIGGCFNFGEEENPSTLEEGYTTYKTDDFSISVPEKWEVINQDEFTSDVPAITLVAFRNNVKNETFTANVNIISKKLQQPVSSLDYAKMVINRESSGMVGFNSISKESHIITINGKETETLLNRYEGKKTADDQMIRYIKTYGVKGDVGYIVTGAFSPGESESVLQTVEKIVKSFRL